MELKAINNKQANAIINWLLKQDDELLQKNIKNCPDKDFNKCWNYIFEKAKAKAENGCAMIEDNVVYGWAKDYFNDYEIREEKRKEKEKEEQETYLKTRKSNLIEDSENVLSLLKNNAELEKKHKTTVLDFIGKLKADLIKKEELDQISLELNKITVEINESEKPKEKVEEKKEDVKNEETTLFDFI